VRYVPFLAIQITVLVSLADYSRNNVFVPFIISVLSLGAVRAQPFCNDALLAVTPQLQTVVRTT